jgi:hypothetical protein
MKGGILNKILFGVILIFFVTLAIFIYTVYFQPMPALGLKTNLIGPNEVVPLENYDYQIRVENYSNKNLTDVNLRIILSEGIFWNKSNQTKEFSFSLGRIEAKNTVNQNLNLFFINEGNFKETIKFILTYKLEGQSHIFEREDSFSILVKNAPLQAQIFIPTKTYLNQEFQVSFKVINLSNKILENIKVKIDTPSNFLLVSTFPKNDNSLYWEFKKIEPKEIKDISLIGQIQNIKSTGIFSAQLYFDYQGKTFILPKEIAKINLLDNPINIEIQTSPAQESIPIGSNLLYEIKLKNKSQTILDDVMIKVKFFGPFDLSSLNSDGSFSQIDQVLSWTVREKNELLHLRPGDEVKLRFSISLFQSYPILENNDAKNFTAKIRVEIKTPTIPAEIEEGTKEYLVYQEIEKKISGKLEVTDKILYGDIFFPSAGPLPLVNEQPTTLSWHIQVKTIGEDFENFALSTRFRPGVNLTGKVGGDAIIDNLKFDPKTGVFFYNINKLPANLGYTQKELDLVFEIVVIPPALTKTNDLIIIPPLQYSGVGSFSKTELNGNLKELRPFDIIQP